MIYIFNITEDEENRIVRIDVTAENWEENKLLAKEMGIEIDEPSYIECTIDLIKGGIKNMNEVNNVRNYVNGASDYNKHKYQVWDFWIKYKIKNGFDCDLTKRVLRIKKTDGRLLDYRKMKHIALERIRQFQNNENVFPIENTEPKDVTFEEMIDDYNLTDDDKIILNRILYPNVKDRVSDYEEIIELCEKRIKELEKEEN